MDKNQTLTILGVVIRVASFANESVSDEVTETRSNFERCTKIIRSN